MFRFLSQTVLLIVLLAAFVSADISAADWPRFHGNNQNTGVSSETLTMPLREKWTLQASSTISFSSPVAASTTIFIGDDAGKFYAINISDGSVSWSFTASGPITTTPAIDGATVYFGDETGKFYARSVTDGTQVWTDTRDAPVVVSPAINSSNIFFGLEDGTIVALDKNTGSEVWTSVLGSTFGFSAFATNIAGNRGFVADNDGSVHKINLANGNISCTFTAPSGDTFDRSSPVFVRTDSVNRIFIGSDGGNIYAIRASNCTQQDSFAIGTDILGTPAYNSVSNKLFIGSLGGDLYKLGFDTATDTFSQDWKVAVGFSIESSPVLTTGGANRLFLGADAMYVFAPSDGDLLWSSPTGLIGHSSIAVYNDEVYLADTNGKIYAYEETRVQGAFKRAWKYNTKSMIVTAVTQRGGNLYLGTADSKLYSLTNAGALNWTFDTSSPISSIKQAVDTTNGVVYFGTEDKAFYAVNSADGTLKWKRSNIGLVTSRPNIKVAQNVIYVPTNKGKLYEFNAGTGDTNFTYDTGFPGLNLSRPLTNSSRIYFTYGNRTLIALNRDDFTKTWEFVMGGSNTTENPIFISKNSATSTIIYAGGVDGVYAIDDNGAQVWKFSISSPITATVFNNDTDDGIDKVYASTQDGRVIGINAADGTQLWSTTVSSASVSQAKLHQDVLVVYSQRIISIISGEDGKLRSSFHKNLPLLAPVNIRAAGGLFVGTVGGKVKKFKTNQYIMDVDAALGGAMTTIFGDKLEIGPGALATDTTITLTISENDQTSPAGTVALPRKYNFGPDGTTFSPAVDFRVAYKDSDLQGEPAGDIRVFVHDSDTNTWQEKSGTLDGANKLFSATLDHFSEFVAFAGIPKELIVPIFDNAYPRGSCVIINYSAGDSSVKSVSAVLRVSDDKKAPTENGSVSGGKKIKSGKKIKLNKVGTNTVTFTAIKYDDTEVVQDMSFEVVSDKNLEKLKCGNK